jgi:hypothetical protein
MENIYSIFRDKLLLLGEHGFIPKECNFRFFRNRGAEQYIKNNTFMIIHDITNWDVPTISSFFQLLMSLSVPMYVG